ncbi:MULTISPECIES: BsuBI/PstI family type II restriction endonuclease [Rothia]|jgi:type-2 restriction enzyme bsuBI|uniref:BsuBI/PstI family type II restriction endonuclease n=1 Tax=Rothia TaxID=32207 RepID=UPI000A9AFB68|nr:BsuBI/PstI family type II restriction endonuclease [Rothia sp. (in: high G+C Gram-positive bacteria)]
MSIHEEAKRLLKLFEFDEKRTNDMAARTLLSLLNLREGDTWDQATNNRIGVRGLMDWMRNNLDFPIAENSRETIRREVLHQFVAAAFCEHNDDDPNRATNSSKNVYRVSPNALSVIRMYSGSNDDTSSEFRIALEEYLAYAPSLVELQREERKIHKIPVRMPSNEIAYINPGGQNKLIKSMVEEFCPRFAPGGQVLYIGDADSKTSNYNEELLSSLGINLDMHGKMPDLVVYQKDKNWLFLMEAVTTHGPVNPLRKKDLESLFGGSKAGIVYVSCFPNRQVLRSHLMDIAWETEVWLESDPTHMIHFNGSRFMGPYES